jgi:hypothetical protein
MRRYGMDDVEAYTMARQLPAAPAGTEGGRAAQHITAHLGLVHDAEWRHVRTYPPGEHAAHVFVCRLPAQFWRVWVPGLGIDVSTGSGQGRLATAIAELAAAGFLAMTATGGQLVIDEGRAGPGGREIAGLIDAAYAGNMLGDCDEPLPAGAEALR